MKLDGYDIDVVMQGYPGKSVCHGGLGWCSIVLLRGHGRVALIDTGSFGMRKVLRERLAEHGYLGKREAVIQVWFAENLDETMLFKLTPPQ